MQAFVKAGKTCFNVDYNTHSIPRVQRIGQTIDTVDKKQVFDLILCSHVIEHVAEPLVLVKRLVTHLTPGGWFLVEVPMEIWKTAPLQHEPVTHINFFTKNSLYNLLILAGLNVCDLQLATYLNSFGTRCHGVKALARPRNSKIASVRLRKSDVEHLLHPNALTYLRYYWANPVNLIYSAKHHLRSVLGRWIVLQTK